MPVKKVYIHLGMPKTGTTSIQSTLCANAGLLNKNGFHNMQEWESWKGNHFLIFQNLWGEGPVSSFKNLLNLISEEERLKENQIIIDKMTKAMNGVQYDVLILTGSYFLALRNLSVMNRMRDFIECHFSGVEVRFILYLRNPLEFIISYFQQLHSFGLWSSGSVDQWEWPIEAYRMALRNLLEYYPGRIMLYKFEDAVQDKNGLVGHFLRNVEYPVNEVDKILTVMENKSRTCEAMEIISYIEDKEPSRVNGIINPKRHYRDAYLLTEILGARFDFNYHDKLAMMSRLRPVYDYLKGIGFAYSDYKVEPKPMPETFGQECVQDLIRIFPKLNMNIQKLFLDFFQKKYTEIGQLKFRVLFDNDSPVRKIYQDNVKMQELTTSIAKQEKQAKEMEEAWNVKMQELTTSIARQEKQAKEMEEAWKAIKQIAAILEEIRHKKYPKWLIHFLCWFVPKKKNRQHLRAYHIKRR
jgi:hypothetical protein